MGTKKNFVLVAAAEKKEPPVFMDKQWTHGADIMVTWKRHGFIPPTEVRNDYFFKTNREGGMTEINK